MIHPTGAVCGLLLRRRQPVLSQQREDPTDEAAAIRRSAAFRSGPAQSAAMTLKAGSGKGKNAL
ncbi:MAG: hypothetical protein QME77_12940, partial [bacterium]|nr:hypothetical protein [bacterium]